jgi:hypothetical protein
VIPSDCRDCLVAIKGSNGRYVSAELGYAATDPRYGILRARADKAELWEIFKLVQLN